MLRSVQKVFPLVLLVALFLLTSEGVCGDGLVVDDSGNVGIGIANPGARFHVFDGESSTGIDKEVAVFSNAGSDGGRSYVIGTVLVATTGGDGFVSPLYANNALVKFGVGGGNTGSVITEYFRINGNGNVGIGTTTPTSKLQLAGTSYSNPSLTNGAPTMASFQSGSGTDFVIGSMQSSPYSTWIQHRHASYAGSSFPISLQPSGGNVGIGTTNPSYKLDVNGDIRGNNVSPSDIRWKTNINTIDNSLEKVSQLRGVTYEWTDPSKGDGQQIGVIAQEVEQVFPEVISTDNQGYKSVGYSKLIAPLIEAVKILKSENEKLRQDNEEIKKQIAELKAACTKLK